MTKSNRFVISHDGKKLFELTKETMTTVTAGGEEHVVHRIKALRDFPNIQSESGEPGIRAGTLGGWVERVGNFWGIPNCNMAPWVGECAVVCGDAVLYRLAYVGGNAIVSGHAMIEDFARVYGNATVDGYATVGNCAQVFDWAEVSGHALVLDYARVFGHAKISDYASVIGHACVFENAEVKDHARLTGTAVLHGTAVVSRKAHMTKQTRSSGYWVKFKRKAYFYD